MNILDYIIDRCNTRIGGDPLMSLAMAITMLGNRLNIKFNTRAGWEKTSLYLIVNGLSTTVHKSSTAELIRRMVGLVNFPIKSAEGLKKKLAKQPVVITIVDESSSFLKRLMHNANGKDTLLDDLCTFYDGNDVDASELITRTDEGVEDPKFSLIILTTPEKFDDNVSAEFAEGGMLYRAFIVEPQPMSYASEQDLIDSLADFFNVSGMNTSHENEINESILFLSEFDDVCFRIEPNRDVNVAIASAVQQKLGSDNQYVKRFVKMIHKMVNVVATCRTLDGFDTRNIINGIAIVKPKMEDLERISELFHHSIQKISQYVDLTAFAPANALQRALKRLMDTEGDAPYPMWRVSKKTKNSSWDNKMGYDTLIETRSIGLFKERGIMVCLADETCAGCDKECTIHGYPDPRSKSLNS